MIKNDLALGEIMTYFSVAHKTLFEVPSMNDNTHFSYQQVLDSIQELRTSLRSDSGSPFSDNWDASTPFWEEGVSASRQWFEDCEFDPRGAREE